MDTYLPAARPIPCTAYDVVVVGGGPSGCTAAAAAARAGARTLLVEASGCLGGMGTSALVPAWCPFTDKQQVIYRGLAWTVFDRARQGVKHLNKDWLDWTPIDAERLKRVYDDLVSEAGAEVVFHTQLAQVDADGGTVRAAVLCNKAGLSAVTARVFIDCTGDADLAVWAGATYVKGNAAGERLMPATHCFQLCNVDEDGYRHGPTLHPGNPASPMYAIVKSGRYPLIPDTHCCDSKVGPGVVGFNAGHIWDFDNTDPRSQARALMLGRRMAAQFREALAEAIPAAYANAHLVQTGSLIGTRETRRIHGDYELTLDDYLARRSFDDEICRNSYFIDVHHAKDEISADYGSAELFEKRTFRYAPGESHGIPYRCLVPRSLRNVLVAGRSISCQQVVQGSIRVMPVCLSMGEAAGAAAAMAAGLGGDVRAIDVQSLRGNLRTHGAYLP
ncbi:MAG: FAD-dependent oxidoreductase [Planctomycetes bacterium]|nr:FAD-dependent oxidoreductase [Planctomycetota bacterium]